MPPKVRSAFEELGRDNDILCWKIADKVSELYAWTRTKEDVATCLIMDACIAASIVMNTDYSAFRIYEFYLVAEKLPTAGLRRRVERIPFNHLLWARQHSQDPLNKITFLEIVNIDLDLMDKNNGKAKTKNDLIQEVTGTRPEKPSWAEKISPQGEIGIGFEPPAYNGTQSVEIMIRDIFDAVEFIEKTIRSLEAQVKTAEQSVMMSRVVENFARGAQLSRTLLVSLVEDLASGA